MWELRHLRYYVVVAEELNFCRAAARLRVAQPSLSLQLRQLEERFGTELFRRVNRRLSLTAAGETLLTEARRLLADADAAVHRVQAVARGQSGRLSIGFVGTAMYDVLPGALRGFRRRFPQVELALEEMPTALQLKALRERKIQLGFLRPPVEDAGLEVEEIVQESLMVALPDQHPLATQPQISLADLAEEPFVVGGRDGEPALFDCYERLTRQAGFTPKVAHQVVHLQTQLGLVAAGLAICLVPSGVSYLRRPGVTCRPIWSPQVAFAKAAVWPKGDCPPSVQGFLTALRQSAGRLCPPFAPASNAA